MKLLECSELNWVLDVDFGFLTRFHAWSILSMTSMDQNLVSSLRFGIGLPAGWKPIIHYASSMRRFKTIKFDINISDYGFFMDLKNGPYARLWIFYGMDDGFKILNEPGFIGNKHRALKRSILSDLKSHLIDLKMVRGHYLWSAATY